jgi:hypothetical protein
MKTFAATMFALLITIFFMPWMCMLAWNGFAWEFNLPTFGYWHWVATVIAIRSLLGPLKVKNPED